MSHGTPVADAAFLLKAGEVGAPIESGDGYMIVKVAGVRPASRQSLAEAVVQVVANAPLFALADLQNLLLQSLALGHLTSEGLGPLLDYALVPSLAGRIAVTIAVLAPLCFALGFPFPLGMEGVKKQLGENSAALMFALNGFGSAGAVALFTRLAPVTGLRTLHLAAGVLYALAAVLWLGLGGFRANRP